MATRQKLAKSLGKEIRLERTKKGLSLKEFEVAEFSIDRHNLSRIENGEKLPTLLTLVKICKVLDIKLSNLLKKALDE